MNVRVLVGDRDYGGYQTSKYTITAIKDDEMGMVEMHFGYGYDSIYPFIFNPTQGEQHGGSVTIDIDAAKWLACALLNVCNDYDNRECLTLKFDAKKMEYETDSEDEDNE